MKIVYKKFIFCVIIAAFFVLISHIFFMKISHYFINLIDPNIFSNKLHDHGAFITFMAYITALLPISIIAYIYYQTAYLIPFKKNIARVFFITILILGVKGELFRQPFMNFICSLPMGLKKAVLFSFLNHLHMWIANFILALLIVYLCPVKNCVTDLQLKCDS